jgi:hypothetical protein
MEEKKEFHNIDSKKPFAHKISHPLLTSWRAVVAGEKQSQDYIQKMELTSFHYSGISRQTILNNPPSNGPARSSLLLP